MKFLGFLDNVRLETKRRVLELIEMLNSSVKARIKEVLLRITK
jgi:hypothetical protein